MRGVRMNKKITLLIAGMTCASCSQRLEKSLKSAEGVVSAQVNFPAEKAYVEFDPLITDVEKIVHVAAKTGYTATPLAGAAAEEAMQKAFRKMLLAAILCRHHHGIDDD
jgi:copper chaperone CopZ